VLLGMADTDAPAGSLDHAPGQPNESTICDCLRQNAALTRRSCKAAQTSPVSLPAPVIDPLDELHGAVPTQLNLGLLAASHQANEFQTFGGETHLDLISATDNDEAAALGAPIGSAE